MSRPFIAVLLILCVIAGTSLPGCALSGLFGGGAVGIINIIMVVSSVIMSILEASGTFGTQ